MSEKIFEKQETNGTDFRQAIRIGISEALSALEEAVTGLTDEQFWSFPVEDKYNIVTMSEHCLQCIDMYCCEVHGKPLTFEAEEKYDMWHFKPDELKEKMVDLPSVVEEIKRIQAVHKSVMDQLEGTTGDDLSKPNPDSWWFEEQIEKIRADAYVRAIVHTMTHIRQIWYMRGVLGVPLEKGWPAQHWA